MYVILRIDMSMLFMMEILHSISQFAKNNIHSLGGLGQFRYLDPLRYTDTELLSYHVYWWNLSQLMERTDSTHEIAT